MASVRTRLWLTSLLVGGVISCVLTVSTWMLKIGPWFPPAWPGWFFALAAVIVGHGDSWDNRAVLAIVTVGNAAFYGWVVLRAMSPPVEG
jgi:hypothetical protein